MDQNFHKNVHVSFPWKNLTLFQVTRVNKRHNVIKIVLRLTSLHKDWQQYCQLFCHDSMSCHCWLFSTRFHSHQQPKLHPIGIINNDSEYIFFLHRQLKGCFYPHVFKGAPFHHFPNLPAKEILICQL